MLSEKLLLSNIGVRIFHISFQKCLHLILHAFLHIHKAAHTDSFFPRLLLQDLRGSGEICAAESANGQRSRQNGCGGGGLGFLVAFVDDKLGIHVVANVFILIRIGKGDFIPHGIGRSFKVWISVIVLMNKLNDYISFF